MLFVDNRTSTAQKIISEYLEWSDRVDIAVAFLRKSGIELVDSSIKKLLDKGGKIRILVGKDFGYTDPDALLYLKSIGIQIKVFESVFIFHPKCYIFQRSDKMKIVLGSSNWTASGLNTGVEWNLSLDESDASLEGILNAFERLWASEHAQDISDDILDEMRNRHNKTPLKLLTIFDSKGIKGEKIEFTFTVNPSFLSSQYYRPITIPGHKQLLRKYVPSTKRDATIVTLDNRRIGGRIHHSISTRGPYYQIRSLNKGDKNIADKLQIEQKIRVEIELYQDKITVYLRNAD